MKKPVKAIRHTTSTRLHIPSAEEAGYEGNNARVKRSAEKGLPVNPIVHRGQDPELYWLDKYKPAELRVPVRSLYRHEHVAPELILAGLYRVVENDPQQSGLFSVAEAFGNATTHWNWRRGQADDPDGVAPGSRSACWAGTRRGAPLPRSGCRHGSVVALPAAV